MSDLINRADAIEAFNRGRVYHKSGIEEILKALPSVSFNGDITDVVVFGDKFEKVVRCKDCHYLNRKVQLAPKYYLCTKHTGEHGIQLDDYCSWGERKE